MDDLIDEYVRQINTLKLILVRDTAKMKTAQRKHRNVEAVKIRSRIRVTHTEIDELEYAVRQMRRYTQIVSEAES